MSIKVQNIDILARYVDFIDLSLRRVEILTISRQVRSIGRLYRQVRDLVGTLTKLWSARAWKETDLVEVDENFVLAYGAGTSYTIEDAFI